MFRHSDVIVPSIMHEHKIALSSQQALRDVIDLFTLMTVIASWMRHAAIVINK